MNKMAEENSFYLIIGLGNPGREYRFTRHNVGFMQVDAVAEKLGVRFTRMESKALVTRANFQEQRIILAKPQTFMNLSGQAVSALIKFYKISLENFLVVYDEVDLPLGSLRLRPKGGSAGHKGMKSIFERLGTQDFPRLRIGVDRPPGRMEAGAHVLQDFSPSEQEIVRETLERGSEAILTFIGEGLDKAMNLFNGSLIDEEA